MDRGCSQHAGPRCSIQDLPTELVLEIMNHLPFPSQFDLACTCKRLAITSRDVLERHQNYYTKYRVASDLDPSAVPLLLRSAFGDGDPELAWHVRSFEVWRDRTTWAEWQTLSLQTPLVAGLGSNPSQFRVSKEDARRYLEWFEEQLGEDLDFELVQELLAQVENGHDGLLKALLFAKLSYLEDLKFVTRSQEAGSCLTSLRWLISKCIQREGSRDSNSDSSSNSRSDSNDDDDNEGDCNSESGSDKIRRGDAGAEDDTAGDNIQNIERRFSSTATVPWPVGFCNIRNVAVGVSSGTWMDDHREEPSTFLFAHLLRLPNIESIYFDKLCAHEEGYDLVMDENEEEYDYEVLPKGSSSVQHIFLHGCSGLLGEAKTDLCRAPRQLLTMSLRHDGFGEYDGSTGMANALALNQTTSLQSLMWYGYGYRNVIGDHCSVLDDEEFDHFKRLPAMKQMSVSIRDIELVMQHADTYPCLRFDPEEGRDDEDSQGNIYDEKNHREFYVRRVATMFPRAMEALVLWDQPEGLDSDSVKNATRLLERGIVKMIEDGRYKNLKAIFLEVVERTTGGPRKQEFCFQDAIEAGAAAGIDVHTITNLRQMQHSIQFPEAPDEYDLKSGTHSGVRPSDWVFDPFLGRRVSPGCRKCGRCDDCYSQYDQELWRKSGRTGSAED